MHHTVSSDSQNNPIKQVLGVVPFHIRDQGSEKLSNSPKVTQ